MDSQVTNIGARTYRSRDLLNHNIIDVIRSEKLSLFDEVMSPAEFLLLCEIDNRIVIKSAHYNLKLFPTSSAVSQMLTRCRVPVNFFHRCPTTIKQSILGHFCSEKTYLFRCKKVEATDFPIVRAILSPQYSTEKDDDVLFPLFFELLDAKKSKIDYSLSSRNITFELDNYTTRLIVTFPNLTTKWQQYELTPAISIVNSETGHSSIWIEPGVYINGRLVVSRYHSIRSIPRIVHRGSISHERVKTALNHAYDIAQLGVVQMMEDCNVTITKKEVEIFIESSPSIPKRFAAIVLAEIQERERINKLHLTMRIIEEAAKLPLIQTTILEQAAGRFMGIFRDHTSRFAKIASDMQRIQEYKEAI